VGNIENECNIQITVSFEGVKKIWGGRNKRKLIFCWYRWPLFCLGLDGIVQLQSKRFSHIGRPATLSLPCNYH